MEERTDFIARTARGVLIRTFETRAQAVAWADTEGADFPGFTVASVTARTIITERVLRRDRSHLTPIASQSPAGAVA